MKLWVDDMRPRPNAGWMHATTSGHAIYIIQRFLMRQESCDYMSLDHDLGLVDGEPDDSRKIVLAMCNGDLPWPRYIAVHSANPVGVEWLEGTITRNAPEGTLKKWDASKTYFIDAPNIFDNAVSEDHAMRMRLRRMRAERGWDGHDIAKRIGKNYTSSDVFGYEEGDIDSFTFAREYARVLGFSFRLVPDVVDGSEHGPNLAAGK